MEFFSEGRPDKSYFRLVAGAKDVDLTKLSQGPNGARSSALITNIFHSENFGKHLPMTSPYKVSLLK
jgi:hypothetical protein